MLLSIGCSMSLRWPIRRWGGNAWDIGCPCSSASSSVPCSYLRCFRTQNYSSTNGWTCYGHVLPENIKFFSQNCKSSRIPLRRKSVLEAKWGCNKFGGQSRADSTSIARCSSTANSHPVEGCSAVLKQYPEYNNFFDLNVSCKRGWPYGHSSRIPWT